MGAYEWNLMGFLFSAGKSCSSSTQTAGAGPGAEERRGGDHTGVSKFYKIDATMLECTLWIQSYAWVDIQELFNEDTDAQADHFLMWSDTFFWFFWGQLKHTRLY